MPGISFFHLAPRSGDRSTRRSAAKACRVRGTFDKLGLEDPLTRLTAAPFAILSPLRGAREEGIGKESSHWGREETPH